MHELLSPELLTAACTVASIYALVALGLNLIYGTLRLLNVAHGEIMMIGAYLSYWMFANWQIGTLTSMLLAMVVAGLLGALCYRLLFSKTEQSRRLSSRLEGNSLLVFFALSVILQNLGSLVFTPSPRSYSYLENLVNLGGVTITGNRLVIVAVSVVVTSLVLLFFRYSLQGLAIRAMIQQRDAASLIGINIERTKMTVFCIGFALAGLAGSLISMTDSITPFSGFSYTMAAFIVVILGGLGSIGGGLIGAVLLAVVEVYGSALTSPAYRSILLYGVFISILFIRPQGLLGRRLA